MENDKISWEKDVFELEKENFNLKMNESHLEKLDLS